MYINLWWLFAVLIVFWIAITYTADKVRKACYKTYSEATAEVNKDLDRATDAMEKMSNAVDEIESWAWKINQAIRCAEIEPEEAITVLSSHIQKAKQVYSKYLLKR